MTPAPIRFPYVHTYKDRHGKRRYYYRRNGRKQRIDGEVGSTEWLDCYRRIHASFEALGKARPKRADLFAMAAEEYLGGPRYAKLAQGTKDRYRKAIDDLVEVLGDAPISEITRGVIIQLRDKIAVSSPRNAIEAVKVIRLIFESARDIDLIDRNPAMGIAPPPGYQSEPHRPWTEEEIKIFKAGARPIWRRALMVLLYTGQRRSDVVKLRRDQIRDGMIETTAGKTLAEVCIPIHNDLADELAASMPIESLYLVAGAGGRPMTPGYMSHGMQKECRRLGIEPNPPLHGLRKNAVMALIEAGCSHREVHAITGQTMNMIEHYARQYDRRGHAKAAILKWQKSAAKGNKNGT